MRPTGEVAMVELEVAAAYGDVAVDKNSDDGAGAGLVIRGWPRGSLTSHSGVTLAVNPRMVVVTVMVMVLVAVMAMW